MRSFVFFAITALFLICAASIFSGDGTVTTYEYTQQVVKSLRFVWISNATGSANTVTTERHQGEIIAVAFEPSVGDASPSDAYDVTVVNTIGFDVLQSQGMNLSQSASSTVVSSTQFLPLAYEKLTLDVKNAGDANAGTVTLFYR